jgi:hypothetical protein
LLENFVTQSRPIIMTGKKRNLSSSFIQASPSSFMIPGSCLYPHLSGLRRGQLIDRSINPKTLLLTDVLDTVTAVDAALITYGAREKNASKFEKAGLLFRATDS